jgi:predicted nuclease of restriction endonuclease-like (RecB) superfamily
MSKEIENTELKFNEILAFISQARDKAFRAVNKELISLYWQIGEYLSTKVEHDGWGKSTVMALSDFISVKEPEVKGFSASNIWRMKQFYEEYRPFPKLAPLVRELSWTNNLIIFSKTKSIEQKRILY